MVKAKYRRPGLYRSSDLREELSNRFGFEVTRGIFYHWRSIGLVPRGSTRLPIRRGCSGQTQAWTDEDVERIAAQILAHTRGRRY
jgi:hypothetical protein